MPKFGTMSVARSKSGGELSPRYAFSFSAAKMRSETNGSAWLRCRAMPTADKDGG